MLRHDDNTPLSHYNHAFALVCAIKIKTLEVLLLASDNSLEFSRNAATNLLRFVAGFSIPLVFTCTPIRAFGNLPGAYTQCRM